jgi:hypothetical protein
MKGVFKSDSTVLMVGGFSGLGVSIVYPSPTFAPIFIIVSVGMLAVAGFIHKHNQYLIKNTLNLRVVAPEHKQNWNATIRTDRISDPDYTCVYLVWFSVYEDEAEKFVEGNVITLTGDTKRIHKNDASLELFMNWIGKNGEEAKPDIWKNKIVCTIKRNKEYSNKRISVDHIGFIKQVHI